MESQRVKSYFLNMARDASQINLPDTPENQKKVHKITKMMNKLAGRTLGQGSGDLAELDLKKVMGRVNLERERFENECLELLNDIEEN